jgi:hypothetical protein
MNYYRLFILDQDDNLVSGVDLRGDTDEEVLVWAGFILQAGRIGELWCGTRYVGRVAATSPAGTASSLGLGLRFSQLYGAGCSASSTVGVAS